jgi:hypothetical protein
MTTNTAIEVKSIMPVSWMGPDVFHVTAASEVAVLMRLDHRGWHACSSKEEAFDGGAFVANGSVDLLEAAAKALAMAGVPATLLRLQEERRAARMRAAESWKWYIARGASGKGAVGTESTGEHLIIDLAATRLPCGRPALELLDRFSNSEIEAIRDAMKAMGPDGWYWPVVVGPPDDDGPAP